MKIAILGAGAFGSALGGVMVENGHDVYYYDPPKGYDDLDGIIDATECTVLSVPAAFASELLDALPKDKPLIVATKGFLTDELFSKFDDFMVVSGPGFADDIKAKKPTSFTITDERIKDLLGADYVKFDLTADKLGVLMCGALKNVYALLAGYLNLERESKKWKQFITETSEEMQALLKANGAKTETVKLVCGIGDLKLTCGLPSRNYEFGQILSQDADAKPDKTVEGLTTLKLIKDSKIEIPDTAVKLKELLGIVYRKEKDA